LSHDPASVGCPQCYAGRLGRLLKIKDHVVAGVLPGSTFHTAYGLSPVLPPPVGGYACAVLSAVTVPAVTVPPVEDDLTRLTEARTEMLIKVRPVSSHDEQRLESGRHVALPTLERKLTCGPLAADSYWVPSRHRRTARVPGPGGVLPTRLGGKNQVMVLTAAIFGTLQDMAMTLENRLPKISFCLQE